MKRYIIPELEIIDYNAEDCLTSSSGVTKNGKYNIEFDLPEWNEEVI